MAIAATSISAPMAAVHAQPYPPDFGALADAAMTDATSVAARSAALRREAESCGRDDPAEEARIIAAAEELEAEARNVGIRADAIADAAEAAGDSDSVRMARDAERMAARAEADAQWTQENACRGGDDDKSGKVNNTNNNNNVDPEAAVYEDFGDEDRHHRRGFRNCGEDCCEGGCGERVGRELPFTGAPVMTVATLGGGLLAMGAVGVLVPVRRRRSTSVK
ncbi:hypothetical protein [Streptosporangium subroseum]|uniref:hypothetical protein n=1 Tax=Streptosporangium subroseum TaxID=106412 RepID=UPI003085F999|nr:hypothetical protein OHB15_13400 [Streptosporangium subroseum]